MILADQPYIDALSRPPGCLPQELGSLFELHTGSGVNGKRGMGLGASSSGVDQGGFLGSSRSAASMLP